MTTALSFVPSETFKRLRGLQADPMKAAGLFADLCRVNTLSMIMRAGSGHIGTSFSSLDMMSWLYWHELRCPDSPATLPAGKHDVFFSSKGHDAPALYAVLIGMGLLGEEYLERLRRLGGLPGHPDVATPFIEANTGSLGMGISKAKGMARASRLTGRNRHFFVLTGDGELQEGQIWESLASAATDGLHEITVIVDRNRIQSDIWVEKVSPAGDLEAKFRAFGWRVFQTNGHDLTQFSATLAACRQEKDKPQVVIADTVKGRGVSFMEGGALAPDERLYLFHSGAPSWESYAKAFQELQTRITQTAAALGLDAVRFETRDWTPRPAAQGESLVQAYAGILADWGAQEPRLVVLDADLAKDCGLLFFEKKFPDRFIECGIAEQDMVSQAGGLALQGMLPVVHSFAAFLTARANEQIFCNATEKSRIVYVGSLAGLLPAAPGHSHQAVRDIAVLAAIPGLALIQPSCRRELEETLAWAFRENRGSTYLRLSNVLVDFPVVLPADFQLIYGRGTVLLGGEDAVLFAYGPVMLAEALKAAAFLKKNHGFSLRVVNLPWLNSVDREWLQQTVKGFRCVFALEDHALAGGQGAMLASEISGFAPGIAVVRFGVEGIPACGQNAEVLKAHGLDAASLVSRITAAFQKTLALCRS